MSLEHTVVVCDRIIDKVKGGAIYQGVRGKMKITTLAAVSKSNL
jgi:hypothetical protein